MLFRLLVAIALRWGLNPNDLKLITALFVFVALVAPQLLRRLAADRWSHWGAGDGLGPVDYAVHERILGIQRVALRHVFNPSVLARIQNTTLKVDKSEKPLTLAELFRGVTDAVWTESGIKNGKDGKKSLELSILMRNLQREHVKDLSNLVLGSRGGAGTDLGMLMMGFQSAPVPPDARSLARFHLRSIDRSIKKVLEDHAMSVDDTTRAHLEECQERIAKVLSASMQVSEP